ncbi:MAG: serine hydrolase domain-containing protein [Planctomycetota bacterium]|nr:serine hydrolase domain-containing protein [Planctomycetota bacterium]
MGHLKYAKPKEIGIDGERLETAYRLLRKWTTGPQAPVPGGAILVGRHGRVIPPRFFGRQGPEPNAEPIREDGLFLLASISKPITYLAGMLQVERGQLNLSDHVARYIPDFAAHHKEETLVEHLFTHTSGMPDMLPNNAELRKRHAPLKTFIAGAIASPPVFAPGTDHKYQSMGTLVTAELVQKLAGRPIREVLRRDLFEPLELEDIALGSRGLDRKRLVRVEVPEYQVGSDFGWNSRYWQEFGAPWGGAFASPEDLAVICQLMLGDGEVRGTRVLAPATVRSMTENRLATMPGIPPQLAASRPWGLGWKLNHRGTSASWGDSLGPTVFGHTGATGTMCWMDRDRDAFCILLTSAIRSRAPWRLVHLSNAVSAAIM